jgi:hypothetical protein
MVPAKLVARRVAMLANALAEALDLHEERSTIECFEILIHRPTP